ncbi:glycerate kinase [Streptococcus parauberis]|uniref:glycerate kinase n=1 Tax=Streptococcus parauberis TaxID=1348 RepID=UPI0002BAD4FB|nr:glycerate kinase [Streptococcus parauberis]EMF48491.1 Glycerate kinase [Streptococcus parauberis KRS-02109]UWM86691.1 glycerate kinase [Streptococcus parauberis]UWM88663.1 glycerate kinase [Streptococcus parauberis]WEM59446.1 glycerate kinase [Streptococcus parauberis]
MFVWVETVDLLNRDIIAPYLLVDDTAFIEVAQVVGIDKIRTNMETFLTASSYGLAKLFLDAKERSVKRIVVCLGGTGSSDGGLGLLRGLGAKVDDINHFKTIDLSSMVNFFGIEIVALADVNNPYAGENGFSHFFGKQKGSDFSLREQQSNIAFKIVQVIKNQYQIDLQAIEGTGAAGGIGGAIVCLGGTIQSGFTFLSELIGLESAIKETDLVIVITGEGKMDYQTANGKVPFGIASIANKYQVDTIAICGTLGENLGAMEEVLLSAFSIQQGPILLADALENVKTLNNLTKIVKMVTKTYFKI